MQSARLAHLMLQANDRSRVPLHCAIHKWLQTCNDCAEKGNTIAFAVTN